MVAHEFKWVNGLSHNLLIGCLTFLHKWIITQLTDNNSLCGLWDGQFSPASFSTLYVFVFPCT